jgi:hypothetical protein
MLGANRDDCTALFQSYHPFNISKAKAVLKKHQVVVGSSSRTSNAPLVKLPSAAETDVSQSQSTKNNRNNKDDESVFSSRSSSSSTSSMEAIDDNTNDIVARKNDQGDGHRSMFPDPYLNHHHNDLFYNVLVEHVGQKLKEHHIDPIKDCTATYQRYFFYIICMMCTAWA